MPEGALRVVVVKLGKVSTSAVAWGAPIGSPGRPPETGLEAFLLLIKGDPTGEAEPPSEPEPSPGVLLPPPPSMGVLGLVEPVFSAIALFSLSEKKVLGRLASSGSPSTPAQAAEEVETAVWVTLEGAAGESRPWTPDPPCQPRLEGELSPVEGGGL